MYFEIFQTNPIYGRVDLASGHLNRPVKQQITLRLDADVIDWFRRHPEREEGYQTSINRALREYVPKHDHD